MTQRSALLAIQGALCASSSSHWSIFCRSCRTSNLSCIASQTAQPVSRPGNPLKHNKNLFLVILTLHKADANEVRRHINSVVLMLTDLAYTGVVASCCCILAHKKAAAKTHHLHYFESSVQHFASIMAAGMLLLRSRNH